MIFVPGQPQSWRSRWRKTACSCRWTQRSRCSQTRESWEEKFQVLWSQQTAFWLSLANTIRSKSKYQGVQIPPGFDTWSVWSCVGILVVHEPGSSINIEKLLHPGDENMGKLAWHYPPSSIYMHGNKVNTYHIWEKVKIHIIYGKADLTLSTQQLTRRVSICSMLSQRSYLNLLLSPWIDSDNKCVLSPITRLATPEVCHLKYSL